MSNELQFETLPVRCGNQMKCVGLFITPKELSGENPDSSQDETGCIIVVSDNLPLPATLSVARLCWPTRLSTSSAPTAGRAIAQHTAQGVAGSNRYPNSLALRANPLI